MPIYTYACNACNAVVEKRQSFSDAPLTTCEACGGDVRRVIHPVGIVFKGSGWYITDSRKSGDAAASTSGGSTTTPPTTPAPASGASEAPARTESAPASAPAEKPAA